MVHEAVHIYGGFGVAELAEPLNEGITEYFTRIVLQQIDPDDARTTYQRQFGVAALLVDRTSEAIVAAAYFDGDHAGLETAFQANWDAKGGDGFTEQPWTEFLLEMQNGAFQLATMYLP